MIHKEYVKKVDGAKTAVLFIHGILGSPNRYSHFIDAAPSDWSVYNILLDGHGSDVDAFAKASMIKWHKQVVSTVEALRGQYDNIIIVAHSLGALLAIDAAVANPAKIKEMLLLAVPLHIRVSFGAVITSLKVVTSRTDDGNTFEEAMKNGYSIEPDKRLWKYIKWTPRYLELFKEMYKIRKIIPRLTVPTVALQSKKDELVATSAAKYLEGNPNVRFEFLPNSMHEYYDPQDLNTCIETFDEICRRVKNAERT